MVAERVLVTAPGTEPRLQINSPDTILITGKLSLEKGEMLSAQGALYVVRHGQTEANASGLLLGRANPELDAVGCSQADALGAALPAGARIISSPATRCTQTADRIADVLASSGTRPETSTDDRLIELDYGEFDLKPISSIGPQVWKQWQADPEFRPPGGETLRELASRVGQVLDEISMTSQDQNIVLVTHVSPIKAAVAWALGVDIAISWRCFVAQASLTKIGYGPMGPSLQLFNGVGHLPTTKP